MTKTYKNPPLIEAVCEFRFDLAGECSKKQIDAFYEKIKSDFPMQKKGKIQHLEFKIEVDKTPKENQKSFNQNSHEFERYFSEDEKSSVQLDGGKVSIHRIRPYTSWDKFLPLIQGVYRSYIESFSPKHLERIGMRYVNEITLPTDNFSFTEYFNIKASLPSLENTTQKTIFVVSMFEQEEGRDAINIRFAERPAKEVAPSRVFVLDFDYFLVTPVVAFSGVDEWLNKAHTNLEGVFEGVITEKTKKLFDK